MAQKLKPLESQVQNSILTSYGDDTYIFAAVGSYNYDSGHEFAKEAIKLCSSIYEVDEYQIRVTVNIGISLFRRDAATKEELIKHADIAMTQARMNGFNVVQEFDEKLSEVIYRKNTIEILLKQANFKMNFMVYYQPQIQTDTKKIIGFEALLRWRTSSGEFIGPNEFIPIAEETGFIIPIGDWVMKMVMQQIVDWNKRFDEKIMIGINVSLKQLNSDLFLNRLKQEMKALSIKPEWVDLEITESKHLQENRDALKMLEDIRKMGVTVSIDDFGTGYSSLSYFKGFPADRIKLAKELIDYIHVDDFDYQLVKSIILLSKAKGIRVIAEGVETKEQWEALKELQCDEVPGYLFGKSAPANEIEAAYGEKLGMRYSKVRVS
jgi:EAL domain-containing protein (putative c-di-GMP-specific phosphodiesterase class I)